MNVGASALTQPATIGGSGGVSIVDPADQGLRVSGGNPPRSAQIGSDFFGLHLVAGDITDGIGGILFSGIWDAATGQPVVGFDYDSAVAGCGSIYFGTSDGTRRGKLHLGSGLPANAGGQNGDFYLRSDTPAVANQRLYVKSAGAWVGIL